MNKEVWEDLGGARKEGKMSKIYCMKKKTIKNKCRIMNLIKVVN